jgi:hypothetical protein
MTQRIRVCINPDEYSCYDKMKKAGGTNSHDEGVCQAGGAICSLVAKLYVVMIDPATVDHRYAIKAGNTCLGKLARGSEGQSGGSKKGWTYESGHQIASDSSNSMRSEDLLHKH